MPSPQEHSTQLGHGELVSVPPPGAKSDMPACLPENTFNWKVGPKEVLNCVSQPCHFDLDFML